MSSIIRVLDELTINQIAAGEVIENPASVVKELVENSIDAGATEICIEIQEGGRQLIRISDNGCGMTQDDALLCLERHATSKIRDVHDIQEIMTMGFRGEAIPSIAAISKFSLLTAPQTTSYAHDSGTLVIIEGGRILSCNSAPRTPGTTIEVKSLFFNVPVRRNFQKSPTYDTQEITKILNLFSMGHPEINFELISDQKPVFKTIVSPKKEVSFIKRIENVLGKEMSRHLLPLQFEQSSYQLAGFIGDASLHRPNRSNQYLFINHRAVYSPLISNAIREGYDTMLPNLRFPVFVLNLHLPGDCLDVNVHPQKREVRLRHEFQIKEAIVQAVQQALRKNQQQTNPSFEILEIHGRNEPPPFWGSYASLLSPNSSGSKVSEESWTFKAGEDTPEQNKNFYTETIERSVVETTSEINSQLVQSPFENSIVEEPLQQIQLPFSRIPRAIATITGYIIVEPFQLNRDLFKLDNNNSEGGLALIDQKAAYSRIYFEKLMKNPENMTSQPLLIPLTLELSQYEATILNQNLSILSQLGFSLREFGEKTFLIDAFPHFIAENDLLNCLNILIQDLTQLNSTKHLLEKKHEKLALTACRASLPKNKQLSIDEAQTLIQQLLECEIHSHCPFGKPIMLYISPQEINKLFRK